jgi:hypothetical protein
MTLPLVLVCLSGARANRAVGIAKKSWLRVQAQCLSAG